MSILAFLVVAVTLISAQAGPKVRVGIYYEGQCGACQWFFKDKLEPTMKELTNYMEVHLVPYGNAKTIRKGVHVTIEYHTSVECQMNRIQACALARMTQESNLKQVQMATCLLEDYIHVEENSAECCSKFGLNWNDVSKCANGIEGTTLLDGYGNETEHIKHVVTWTGTPTIVVNGKEPDTQDIKQTVCDTLAAEGVTPDACKQ